MRFRPFTSRLRSPLGQSRKPEDASLVERRIVQALDAFFHPLTGGEQSDGWPFGRSVYISEVFALIERSAASTMSWKRSS